MDLGEENREMEQVLLSRLGKGGDNVEQYRSMAPKPS
jgi:hypothetical protein